MTDTEVEDTAKAMSVDELDSDILQCGFLTEKIRIPK
jgi:hypothetical protein